MSPRHYRAALAVALAIAPSIVGCGTDTVTFPSATSTTGSGTGVTGASSTATGSGGTSGSGSSGGAGGASTSDSSASSGTGGTAGGRRAAFVSVVSGPESDIKLHSFTAKAGFVFSPDGTEAVFTTSTVGSCEIRLFTVPPTMGTPSNVDAGVITITGGKVPVTLTPNAMSAYALVSDPAKDLFDGGEMITITAAGGTVPAFTASLTASVGVDVTLPLEPPNKGPLPVDRTSDLVFTWNNGGPGDVIVFLNDGVGSRVYCTFSSAAGTGTVPKAALAKLSAGSKGSFGVASITLKTVTVGSWPIQLAVGTAFTWNGAFNPQTFQFQATN